MRHNIRTRSAKWASLRLVVAGEEQAERQRCNTSKQRCKRQRCNTSKQRCKRQRCNTSRQRRNI
jgi:hypothetical protein